MSATEGDSQGKMDEQEQQHQPRVLDPKRRRVTRVRKACDDCRGRKIKCDGGQPCESCVHYKQVCAYSRDARPRYGGAQYTEKLEQHILRLKFALRTLAPEIDIDDVLKLDMLNPSQDAALKLFNGTKQTRGSSWLSSSRHAKESSLEEEEQEQELLDTMIEATGRLDIDRKGGCDYLGDFAGLSFLDRISRRCSQLINPDARNELSLKIFPLQAFRSPASSLGMQMVGKASPSLLPTKTVARRLTKIALKDACCLLNFVHQPSFEKSLDRIYDTVPENYTTEDQQFLALLYLTLALGELYSKGPPQFGPATNDIDKMKGSTYFRAGQALVDVMDCHDLTSLQSILCMILYFQSSGLMHSCYSYISLAIASAFRMGLHRCAVLKFFDPVQQETRKRAFWVLQTMDTYVATMLGVPKNIRDEDLDQDFPLNVDDEFITEEGVLPAPAAHLSNMAVVNAHTKLLLIMANVITYIYPNQKDLSREHSSYHVDYARIVKVEADLEEWFRNVVQPPALDALVSPEALRIQLLLRLAYAHVQMVLYRPFIQHLVRDSPENSPDMKSYACASACVKAAMQIVWLVDEMDKRELLIGAYWFTVYIMFFAIMSLCMFILGNEKDPTTNEVMKAALKGREILVRLAPESASAARCVASLGNIFERLSSTSSNTTTVLSAIPAHPIFDGSRNSSSEFDGSVGSAPSSAGSSAESLSIDSYQTPEPHTAFAMPPHPFSDAAFDQYDALAQQPMEYQAPMMPLAAYTQGLGEASNLFPVFAPAWLDQASALQTLQQRACEFSS